MRIVSEYLKHLFATQQIDVNAVQEDPDELGYWLGGNPFVEDRRPLAAVADSLKVPDAVPNWMVSHG